MDKTKVDKLMYIYPQWWYIKYKYWLKRLNNRLNQPYDPIKMLIQRIRKLVQLTAQCQLPFWEKLIFLRFCYF